VLYETLSHSAHAWSMLNGITQSYLPPTPDYLNPQSSTAVTHYLLIATHFTDPRKDDSTCQAQECHRELNLGRWHQRRVEYITTQPPTL